MSLPYLPIGPSVISSTVDEISAAVGVLVADAVAAIEAHGDANWESIGSVPSATDNADAVWTRNKRTLTGERGRISRE